MRTAAAATVRPWWFALVLGLTVVPALFAVGSSGHLIGYALQEGGSVCSLGFHAPTIQTPLIKPYNRDSMQWWYAMVEEVTFSNVNFIGLNFRGDSPCGITPPPGGEPTSFATNLVNAINTRGYTPILKIALFDDTGSYPWHIQACTGNPNAQFDLGNQSHWQSYFWDKRWLPFFQRVPDANRMKINGRPLIIVWSVAPPAGFYNHAGNLRPLIEFLRARCQATFGFNPFIVVDRTWLDNDPAVGAVVDGTHRWIQTSPNPPWSLSTHNGPSGTFTTGVANPGFWVPTTGQYTDRAAGNTLRNALWNIRNAHLAFFEGLTNIEENAGFYRGANLCNPACGSPYTPPPNQCWSHANQYLNIVRETVYPYIRWVEFQAEACDTYQVGSVSSGLYRRDGNLDIAYANAGQSQWSVRLKTGEWLEFRSFQMGASSNYRVTLRYSSATGGTARLLIDGVEKLSFSLGPTGSLSTYTTVQIPTRFSMTSGNHDIRFQVQSGDIRLDVWTINEL